jgi:hypothetical protein
VARLVDLYGQARVVAFYRAIAGGLRVDRAVRSDPQARTAQLSPELWGDQAQFVDGWKRYLQTLAHRRMSRVDWLYTCLAAWAVLGLGSWLC